MTPEFIASPYFHAELNNALDQQCRLGLEFCLPVYHKLAPESRPDLLIDMTSFDYDAEDFWQRLESAIKSNESLCLAKASQKLLQQSSRIFSSAPQNDLKIGKTLL